MFQSWRHLLFLHWEVDPAIIGPSLPEGLVPDLFEGRAYLGVVPFFMQGVRPRGLPSVPGISNFLELNVRTYVHDATGQPGVWFYSLDASNPLACAIARRRFHLAYHEAEMHATRTEWIDYHCRRRTEHESARFRYRGRGPEHQADPGSLEFFLVERYLLYAYDRRSDRLLRGRVHHSPYQIRDAEVEQWSTLPVTWNGLASPAGAPHHACYSREARVEVFSLERDSGSSS